MSYIKPVVWRIEIWNPIRRKYEITWEGSQQFVDTMFNKSYIRQYTRRVVKITEEIVHKEWKGR